MKKFLNILLAFLFLISAFTYKYFSVIVADGLSNNEKNIDINGLENLIENEHKAFQEVNGGNRVSFLDGSYNPETGEGEYKGEQIASNYIYSRLKSFIGQENNEDENQGIDFISDKIEETIEENINVKITQQWFGERFSTARTSIWGKPQEIILYSNNVILSFDAKNTDKKIVIGANYDNNFDGEYDGAIQTGSSVAILLALAQKFLQVKDLPLDIDIVFFGAGFFKGTPYHMGSRQYVEKMQGNILMMINLSRLGGDTTYIYSDEVNSILEDYFLRYGNLNRLPKSLPHILGEEGPKNIPYTHYGMIGNHSKFMQEGIPTINLFGGSYKGFFLFDSEGQKNILSKDNIQNMLAAYPSAYSNMAKIASVVFDVLTNSSIESVINNSIENKFNYTIFLQKWIAYLILGALLLIGFIVLRYKSIDLLKKYPLKRMEIKHISIFGEEYDNK